MDLREVREFIKDFSGIIIVIAVVILLKIFIITPTTVVGDSMKGTVNNNDWLIMEMISPKIRKFKRFEIIVVSEKSPKYIVKRIIGLPGETIEYKDNKLYIDGKHIEEQFLQEGIITDDIPETKIPKDKYYVVGDNREVSVDSRSIGPIEKSRIAGKVLIKIWPANEIKLVK